MSRCLPFPPPGYEKAGQSIGKKAPVDADLSSKKKRKHKHKEEEKKDKRDKKNRRHHSKCNGDIRDSEDNEKHVEAELGDQKHALLKSSNSANAIIHHRPTSPSNFAEVRKNGRLREPESISRVCDNAGRAEQPSAFEGTTVVSSNHNDVQLAKPINNHSVSFQEGEHSYGMSLPPNGGRSHVLKSMPKELNAVNGELDRIKSVTVSASLRDDSTTGISQTKAIHNNQKPKSEKRRHSKFKGFLEFPALVQNEFCSADSEEWLFSNNRLRNTSNLNVDVEGHKFRAPENGPVHRDCMIRHETGSESKDGVPQVWAEASFLPSVGIYALPYVLPY